MIPFWNAERDSRDTAWPRVFIYRRARRVSVTGERWREWWDRNTKTLTMGGKMSKLKKSSRSTRSKDRRKEKGPKGASPTPPSGKQ